MTKLDVLTGLPEVQVCVAYDTPRGRTRELPIDHLGTAQPVYQSFPGWSEALASARTLADLPATTRAYLTFLTDETGVPVDLVSVGARRDETIVLRDPFV